MEVIPLIEVASRLGITRRQAANLALRGHLTPIVPAQIALFSATDVAKLSRERQQRAQRDKRMRAPS